MLFGKPAYHTIDQFNWNKSSKIFTAEASDLQGSIHCNRITIQNTKTGNTKTFEHVKDDLRGGDLMGRRYSCGDLSLLIIND